MHSLDFSVNVLRQEGTLCDEDDIFALNFSVPHLYMQSSWKLKNQRKVL